MKTALNVLFKSMQRDDKKEVLKFEVKGGELAHSTELNEMVGNIVVAAIQTAGYEPPEITAEFATLQRDSKKTVIKLAVKGDSEDESIELYKLAGMNVTLELQPSQMSIDEYDEPREGVRGTINLDGTVEVDPDQMSIEDIETDAENADALPDSGKVTDIDSKRQQKAQEATGTDDKPKPLDDDDLPF